MRTLKIGVQWLAIGRWQQSIERIIETDLLATPGEFAEELSVSHSTVIMHLKQIGMVKSLINGCLISWPKKKKSLSSCVVFSYFATAVNHFLTGLWYETKSGFYLMTSNHQLSGWTEKKLRSTSQSQACTKKRSRSLFGDLLMFWATAAFWILMKPLHLRSMLSRLMTCSKCLQPVLVKRKGPVLPDSGLLRVVQPVLQKLNDLGCEVLPYTPYSPDLLPTDSHFFKHLDNFFCRENASTMTSWQKMLSKSSLNPEAWIFKLPE